MELLKREQIKDRMIQIAASQWQIPENEIEANFDPLLALIFDTLAGEVETLGHQISEVQNNLLNKLASIMLPQSLLRAKPASCIITAQPTEKTAFLNNEDRFSTIAINQQAGGTSKETEISFTPNGEVKLFNLHIVYLRIGSRVYKQNDTGAKELQHQNSNDTSPVNEIQLALHSNDQFDSLKGLQVFFDLKGHSEAANCYFVLQHSNIFINDSPASFSKGYFNNQQYEINLKDSLHKDEDYCRKIQLETAAVYSKQFITIQEDSITTVSSDIPMVAGLPEKLQQEIQAPNTIYLTIKLCRYFPTEVLNRMVICANAFPVINRKLEKINYKTDKWINIIPIPVTGSFLDIKNVESIDGFKYKLRAGGKDQKIDEGQAIIRTARVEKNNSQNVRNTINSLMEATRDESAYFSKISNDSIATQLNEIAKILARLQDNLTASKDEKPFFQYALLHSQKEQDTVIVEYWSTTPEEAEFIKASAAFKPVLHTKTRSTNFALTNAAGGVGTFNDYTQRQMLVRQLSSRGKIISKEDVKLLCYELFDARLKKVVVDKKMKILPNVKTGISRVITIDLYVKEGDYSQEELTHLQNILQHQLNTNACFAFPFEISTVQFV